MDENNLLQELYYFIFVFSLTWLLPLLVMLMSYLAIFVIIYWRTKQFQPSSPGKMTTRRHGGIGRARLQTVKVTGVLVTGFVLCWTPYNVMALW